MQRGYKSHPGGKYPCLQRTKAPSKGYKSFKVPSSNKDAGGRFRALLYRSYHQIGRYPFVNPVTAIGLLLVSLVTAMGLYILNHPEIHDIILKKIDSSPGHLSLAKIAFKELFIKLSRWFPARRHLIQAKLYHIRLSLRAEFRGALFVTKEYFSCTSRRLNRFADTLIFYLEELRLNLGESWLMLKAEGEAWGKQLQRFFILLQRRIRP